MERKSNDKERDDLPIERFNTLTFKQDHRVKASPTDFTPISSLTPFDDEDDSGYEFPTSYQTTHYYQLDGARRIQDFQNNNNNSNVNNNNNSNYTSSSINVLELLVKQMMEKTSDKSLTTAVFKEGLRGKKFTPETTELEFVLFIAISYGYKEIALLVMKLPGAERALPKNLQLLQQTNPNLSNADQQEIYKKLIDFTVSLSQKKNLVFNAENIEKLQTVFALMIQEAQQENLKKLMIPAFYNQKDATQKIDRETLLMFALEIRNWSAAQLIVSTGSIVNIPTALQHVQKMNEAYSYVPDIGYETTRTTLTNYLSKNNILYDETQRSALQNFLSIAIKQDPAIRFGDVKIILSNDHNVQNLDIDNLLDIAVNSCHGVAIIFLLEKKPKNIAQMLLKLQQSAIPAMLIPLIGKLRNTWKSGSRETTYPIIAKALYKPNLPDNSNNTNTQNSSGVFYYNFSSIQEKSALEQVLSYMIENYYPPYFDENEHLKGILRLESIQKKKMITDQQIGFLYEKAVSAGNTEITKILTALLPHNIATQLSQIPTSNNSANNNAGFYYYLSILSMLRILYERPILEESAQQEMENQLVKNPILFLENNQEKPAFINFLKKLIMHSEASKRADAITILSNASVFNYLDTDGTDIHLNQLVFCAFSVTNIDVLKILLNKKLKTKLGSILLAVEKTPELSQDQTIHSSLIKAIEKNPIPKDEANCMVEIILAMLSGDETKKTNLMKLLEILNAKNKETSLSLSELPLRSVFEKLVESKDGDLIIKFVALPTKNQFLLIGELLEILLKFDLNTTWAFEKQTKNYDFILRLVCQKIRLNQRELSPLANQIVAIDLEYLSHHFLSADDSLFNDSSVQSKDKANQKKDGSEKEKHPDPKVDIIINEKNILDQIKDFLVSIGLSKGSFFLIKTLFEIEKNKATKTNDINEFLKFLAIVCEEDINEKQDGFDPFYAGYMFLFSTETFGPLTTHSKPILVKFLKQLIKRELNMANKKLASSSSSLIKHTTTSNAVLLLQKEHIDSLLDIEDCSNLLGFTIIDLKNFNFAKIFIDKIMNKQKTKKTSDPVPVLEAFSIVIQITIGNSSNHTEPNLAISQNESFQPDEQKIQVYLLSKLDAYPKNTFNKPEINTILTNSLIHLIKYCDDSNSVLFFQIFGYLELTKATIPTLKKLLKTALLATKERIVYSILTKIDEVQGQEQLTVDFLIPALEAGVRERNYALVELVLKITEEKKYSKNNLFQNLLPQPNQKDILLAAQNHDYEILWRLLNYIISHKIQVDYNATLATIIQNQEFQEQNDSALENEELEKIGLVRTILNDKKNNQNLSLQCTVLPKKLSDTKELETDWEIIEETYPENSDTEDLLTFCNQKKYWNIALLLLEYAEKVNKKVHLGYSNIPDPSNTSNSKSTKNDEDTENKVRTKAAAMLKQFNAKTQTNSDGTDSSDVKDIHKKTKEGRNSMISMLSDE